MATFLELVADYHREIGLQGTAPAAVTGQTGVNARLVENIAEADYRIQCLRRDWNFLHEEYEVDTVIGQQEYAAPTDLGSYDIESFVLDKDTDDYQPLKHIRYKEWREKYGRGVKENSTPYLFAINPDTKIILEPPPDEVVPLTCDYWKSPTRLSANTSASPIPERFHRIIVLLAKIMWYDHIQDQARMQLAGVEYQQYLQDLKDAELPDRYEQFSQPPGMEVRAE